MSTNHMNHYRQTGRTTRMLQAAVKRASIIPNENVYVVFATKAEVQGVSYRSDIKFPGNVIITSITELKDRIFSETLTIKGVKEENAFFDHGVIETYFSNHVKALHGYDKIIRLGEIDINNL